VLIAQLSWRWVFFINVPVGAALLVLALKVLPRSERSVQRYRPDVWGVVLLASFMLSIMVATTALAHLGQWFPDAALGFACLACAASARGIVRHSSRRENPLIPMRFVSGPGFRVVNLINVVYGACVLGLATLLPLYAQGRYHLSVLESGALLTARAVGSIVVATAAAFLLERTGYRTPIRIGLAGIALGFLLTAIQPAGMPVLPWLVGAAAITGIGFGVSTPAASNAALALAPNAVGVVTGLRGVGRQAGAITAVSIATGVASLAGSQSVALAVVFAVAAACVLALLPLVRQLPEDGGQPA
jgi:MFS family permease